MKKIIRNNYFIAFVFFIASSLAMAPAAMGNDSNRVKPGIPVEMRFLGMQDNQPLFQLLFTGNEEQNDFTITVRDEFNEVLYRENIRGEIFSRRFLLNSDELGDATLLFEIFSRKTHRSVVYQVNRGTKLVQDVSVSMLK